jgi:Flp pilus assembly protein TadD
VITLEKHLAYAHGYLALELPAEARAELTHLPVEAFATAPVLAVRLEIAMAESAWAEVIALAPDLVQHDSTQERPWTAWAYALRELQRIPEAQETLLTAARLISHPTVLVDYNLACYACLLGELAEARRLLAAVCARDKSWRAIARDDPDLAALYKPTP